MRVMCINTNWVTNEDSKEAPRPVYGNFYEVIQVKDNPLYPGDKVYVLEEFSGYSYCVKCFIPVDDAKDEQEMLQQRIKDVEKELENMEDVLKQQFIRHQLVMAMAYNSSLN